jgi:hypothetical protein
MLFTGYTLNVIRYLSASEPTSVLEATATPLSSTHPGTLIDTAISATLTLPATTTSPSSDAPKATLFCSLALPLQWGFIPRFRLQASVHCESGDVELFNFVAPSIYHQIKVRRKTTQDGREQFEKRVETAYVFKEGKGTGEDWWTTFVIVNYF